MTPAPHLRLGLPDSPVLALGLAVEYLMAKPAFAKLAFGSWSRVLVGQINRGHCRFVIDNDHRVLGFAGWALTSEAKAEAWMAGREPLGSRDARDGDCVVFNAWSAESPAVHRFMVAEILRRLFASQRRLYFRRLYADGRVRPARLDLHRRGASNARPLSVQAVRR